MKKTNIAGGQNARSNKKREPGTAAALKINLMYSVHFAHIHLMSSSSLLFISHRKRNASHSRKFCDHPRTHNYFHLTFYHFAIDFMKRIVFCDNAFERLLCSI